MKYFFISYDLYTFIGILSLEHSFFAINEEGKPVANGKGDNLFIHEKLCVN